MVALNLTLQAILPFRLDLTVWALRRRKSNIVDRWDGHRYARTVPVGGVPLEVSIVQDEPVEAPQLSISLPGAKDLAGPAGEHVVRLMRKVLGLDLDLRPFYALTRDDPIIGGLVRQYSGVKPPRFPTIFEALLNAIACQQVSLDAGIILLNRLAERYGTVFDDGARGYAFPEPESLANAPAWEIRGLGFSYQKVRAIRELAASVSNGDIDLGIVENMPDQAAIEYLCTLRGIGRWSAEYVLLRGLRRMDTFPADDVGARNSLRQLFHLDHSPDYGEIKALTSRWHPYEGLIYFHLLLNKLHLKGVL